MNKIIKYTSKNGYTGVIKTADQPDIDKWRAKKERVIGLMSAHYPVDVRSAVVKIAKKAIIVLNVERI